jgi:hypothetical protein
MPEIGSGINLRLRMQPGGDVVACRMKESTKLHHLAAALISHRASSGVPPHRVQMQGQRSAALNSLEKPGATSDDE